MFTSVPLIRRIVLPSALLLTALGAWGAESGEATHLEPVAQPADGVAVAGTPHDPVPRTAGYRRLREALSDYTRIARNGGFPQLAPGPTLRPGSRGPRVGCCVDDW